MKGTALERDQYRGFAVDLAVFFLLAFFVLIPFHGTIFDGVPVSKICLLKVMDAVQAPELCAPWCITDDLSTSMAHVPNEYFARYQNSGDLPLWNPLNGAGRPFLAEFQTLPFSFFHQVFPANSEYLYNLGLVFKVFISAAGTYFLARTWSLSRMSSLAAALAFALCPHCLRFNELVNNYCFYPWLSLAFVWFASKPSLLRATLAGLLTAATAYNMHPETFACGAVLAAAIAGIKLMQQSNTSALKSVLKASLWIAYIATVAFCAAAPVVLPLVEFISNGASYKFASHDIEHMQWSNYLLSLVIPAGSGSAYIGLVLGVMLPLGLSLWAKKERLLLGLFVLISLFSVRPLFLEQLLSLKPFAFLLPEYTLYAAILLACLCGAAGLDEFVSAKHVAAPRRRLVFGAALIYALLVLVWQLPTVNTLLPKLTSYFFENLQALPFVLGSLAVLALACAAVFVVSRFERFRLCVATLLVLSNSILLITLVPTEMGPREHFQYQENEVTRYLQTLNGRIVATGYNIFQPNTNLVYGTTDFRATAPLFPSRYTKYLKLGNAGAKFCTIPESPVEMNAIFDLASVRYILSDRALERANSSFKPLAANGKHGTSAASSLHATSVASRKHGTSAASSERDDSIASRKQVAGSSKSEPVASELKDDGLKSASQSALSASGQNTLAVPFKLADGVRLDELRGYYEPQSKQYFVDASFTVHKFAEGHYSAVLAVTDKAGIVLQPIRWLNDRIEEVGTKCGEHKYRMHFNVVLAEPVNPDAEARLFVRDNWSAKVLDTAKTGSTPGIVVPCELVEGRSDQFKKIATLPGPLFVYENERSLPRVYLSQEFQLVRTADESLAALEKGLKQGVMVTVLEDPTGKLTTKSGSLDSSSAETGLSKSGLSKSGLSKSGSASMGSAESSSAESSSAESSSAESSSAKASSAESSSAKAISANSGSSKSIQNLSIGRARILDSSADSVSIIAENKQACVLVLNDTFYPDWHAEVDGKESKIYAANHMFRAIELPAGKHIVVFSYKPRLFALGCQLLTGSIFLLLLVIVAQFLSLRRKSNGSTQSRSALQNVA